jgi:hypothetical protein
VSASKYPRSTAVAAESAAMACAALAWVKDGVPSPDLPGCGVRIP